MAENTNTEREASAILSKICDLFHIGKQARTESTIIMNVENVIHHARLLHAVERDLFPQPELPEDDDPYASVDDELPAPNSWAAKDEADYVAQFRAALAARASLSLPAAGQEPVVPDWWRKRADEIELEVARSGSTKAMRCFTDMRTLLQAVAAAPQPAARVAGQEPVAWTGGEEWEHLAWHLCAEENGEESCGELIWEVGPVPEPWGERWLKYEGEAKRMIELVRKFAAPQPAVAAGWVRVQANQALEMDCVAKADSGPLTGGDERHHIICVCPDCVAPKAGSELQEDAAPDYIRELIAQHSAILDENESAYFELCYHRATGWMAWITDKPMCMPPVVSPDRKVLAQGQGGTPDEACRDAAMATSGGRKI